jgi:hypothetical protein
LRSGSTPLREIAWVLHVSQSVLGDWNRVFDEAMRALEVPENRGKASKITVEMVRVIVRVAEEIIQKGKRLRIKGFTKELREKEGIDLSKRKVREVLIANNLFAPETRIKRPRFYLSLRKEVPNGLLSLDGSQMVVWIDKEPYKFNVELGVDVKTFDHTSFSVGDSESSEELIKVLEAHREKWGDPVGVLFDHRSSNLSEEVRKYLESHGVEIVPAGPYNAKGNGTDEGAFSQMKQALGMIRLNVSSPRQLARSVLEKLISLYIAMRNRISVRGRILTPSEDMATPVTMEQRDLERQKLKEHNRVKTQRKEDQDKLDQLHSMLRYHGIAPEPDALKHAERSIKGYEKEAISAAEDAFLKAVNRNPEKRSLSYFFGILVRIQRERDDEAYRRYCTQRYNEEVMMRLKRQGEDTQKTHSVKDIVGILVQAVKASVQFIREVALRKAREWTQELMTSYRYVGALKNSFLETLGNLKDLTIEEKNRIWELIEQILNPKTTGKSVTQIS